MLVAVAALAALTGCTSQAGAGDERDTVTVENSSPISSAQPPMVVPALDVTDNQGAVVDEAKSGKTVVHVENRAGNWDLDLGGSHDSGRLALHVACVGGYEITVGWTDAKGYTDSSEVGCDGGTLNLFGEQAPAKGPVRVSVAAPETIRWSLQAARG